jgi:hypothetical protein
MNKYKSPGKARVYPFVVLCVWNVTVSVVQIRNRVHGNVFSFFLSFFNLSICLCTKENGKRIHFFNFTMNKLIYQQLIWHCWI